MFTYKIIYKTLTLILCSAIILAACSALPTRATPTAEPPKVESVSPVISATGVVNPPEYSTLSVSMAGLIAEVLVKEGDAVQEGQVLMRLKGTEDLQSAIAAANYEQQAAQKALDDLSKNAETDKIQTLQAIASYTRQVRDAQYQFDNYEVPSNQKSLDPTTAVDTMKARYDKAFAAYEPCQDKYTSTEKQDSVCEDLQDDLDDAEADYNAAVKRLDYLTNLQAAQANLAKAQEDYAIWKNGPDPKDIAVAQARLDNAKAALAAAKATLDKLELKALFAGTVSELYVHTGEWVVPGAPILLLADLSHLRVETTDLNEIDAARVAVGDAVKVTFDALPEVVIEGKVKSIAPKSSKGSGVNYMVIVDLSELPDTLRWGMTAFVDITVK